MPNFFLHWTAHLRSSIRCSGNQIEYNLHVTQSNAINDEIHTHTKHKLNAIRFWLVWRARKTPTIVDTWECQLIFDYELLRINVCFFCWIRYRCIESKAKQSDNFGLATRFILLHVTCDVLNRIRFGCSSFSFKSISNCVNIGFFRHNSTFQRNCAHELGRKRKSFRRLIWSLLLCTMTVFLLYCQNPRPWFCSGYM